MIKYFDDENLIIPLWHEAFGNSDEDIVFFLKNCKHKKCLGYFEDDELCSMLFLVDCKVTAIMQNIFMPLAHIKISRKTVR